MFLIPVSSSGTTTTTMKKKQLLVMPKQKVYSMTTGTGSTGNLNLTTTTCDSMSNKKENANIPSANSKTQSSPSKSILIRTSPIKIPFPFGNKSPVRHHQQTMKPAVKLTEKQQKDNFMKFLGLVTKEALIELQSRRNERKRRTTANPQFSNAALEAKRIQNQEIAERRAKRRLLISTAQSTGGQPTNKTYLIPKERRDERSNFKSNSQNNPMSLSSTIIAHVLDQQSNTTVVKPIQIERQELSNGIHLVASLVGVEEPLCFDCHEQCETDCDSVLFCKFCKSLFHATCLMTLQDIIKKSEFKCIKCEKQKKQLQDELAKKLDRKKQLLDEKKEWDDKVENMKEQLAMLRERIVIQQKMDKFYETVKIIQSTDIDIGLCIEV